MDTELQTGALADRRQRRRPIWPGVALALALAGPAAAADLAVRPGLWEVTTGDALSALVAQLPHALADKLAHLSPQRQAAVQRRLAALGISGGAARICVTRAMLHRALTPMTRDGCTATPSTTSPTEMSATLACTGNHRAQGSAHLQATSPTSVTGVAEGKLSLPDGTTLPLRRSFQARWIAADCGGVRPID
jgi:hypothetical protein